jgi:hypothetical protein
MLTVIGCYFTGYFMGFLLGPVAIILIIALALYSALAAVLNNLAARYAAYRFAHPPKPPTSIQIKRRKLIRQICCAIYLVPWAIGSAVLIGAELLSLIK